MPDSSKTTRGIAWLALSLFVGGLLLPFPLYALLTSFAVTPRDTATFIAIGVGMVSGFLALILGIVGWRNIEGKIAALGGGGLLAVGLFILFA